MTRWARDAEFGIDQRIELRGHVLRLRPGLGGNHVDGGKDRASLRIAAMLSVESAMSFS